AVEPDELRRSAYSRFDRKRLERGTEVLLRHAVAAEELDELRLRLEIVALLVELREEVRVHLVDLAEQLGRVERTRVHDRDLVPRCRNTHEVDVVRLLLDPGFEMRLERIAAAAAVHEYLGDLDFAFGRARGLRRGQRDHFAGLCERKG